MLDFINFSIIDIIDILVVAFLLYQIYRVVRGTGALAIFAGIFVIYITWIVVRVLGMELLSSLLGQIIGIGALAIIVVFQQEIRRYLLMLGRRSGKGGKGMWYKIFSGKNFDIDSVASDEIYEACVAMASQKVGALVVIERSTDIEVYMSTGDRINGIVSRRLIESIFFKNSPLHDGAMIISGGRIAAARCILPTSDNPNIPANLGLRHRAGVGLSENSDAMIIVVSEETGRISIVQNGAINRLAKPTDLKAILDSN